MDLQNIIDEGFADMKALFETQGRSISVKTADNASCVIEVKGFCQGGCACTESYMAGVEELIREKAPQIKVIEFIQS